MPYRYWLAQAQRNHSHLLPAAQEELLSGFAAETAGWQDDLYEAALERADMGTVTTPHGVLDVRRQRNLIAVDSDPTVRRQGFEKRLAGLAAQRDDVAFALLHLARANNDLARAHGFADAPDRAYFAMGLDPAAVRAVIARVLALGDLQKRFERLRAAEVTRAFGVKEAGPWDMSVLAHRDPEPHAGAGHPATARGAVPARRLVLRSAGRTGLAPANGRLDLVPGGAPHRSAGGGFSVGFAGAQSALFVGAFDGAYKDLSVMGHEGGHAVHRALMTAHGVRPLYSSGPAFLFEFLRGVQRTRARRRDGGQSERSRDAALLRGALSRRLRDSTSLAGAQDAAVEQAVYDGVRAGTLSSADDIDALNAAIITRVSIWPDKVPAMKASWEGMSLAFEDPFYDVNYMYASMLALEYFRLYKEKLRLVPAALSPPSSRTGSTTRRRTCSENSSPSIWTAPRCWTMRWAWWTDG